MHRGGRFRSDHMQQITAILFLCFFIVEFLIEALLNRANMRFVVQQWQNKHIPDLFIGQIQQDEYEKSVQYTLARGRFDTLSACYGSALTLVVLFGGVLPFFDDLARHWGSLLPGYTQATGILFCFLVGFFFTVTNLPVEYYSTFVLEERFGFNKTTATTFALDKVKGLALGVLLAVPFLFGVLWLMQASGSYWWIWVFCFIFAFQFLMMIVFPTFIAPLFNKFEALPENELREAIAKLAERVGIKTSGIFTMDGSKRSGHSNAYFTGLGKAKRIVLFDTLLNQLNQEQLLSVLAHEMGHYRKKHVPKGLLLSAVFLLLGLFVLSHLIDYPPLFQAFGLAKPTHYGALVVFSLISGPFTFWLGPLMNYISRKHEYEADRFATDLLKDGTPLAEALVQLTLKNLSNLTPHPWYSAYHYSHPSTVERVGAIQATRRQEFI